MADPVGNSGHLPPPSAAQLGWLSVAPPTDEHGAPIHWTISDCQVEEQRWTNAIVHNLLTIERVQFVAVQWTGPVFRNCVIRDVSFERCNFSQARFESVSFERCSFTRSTFEDAAFDHCRFVDCTLRFQRAIGTALRFCEISGLELDVLDMRECELAGTRFLNSRLSCPRISKTRGDQFELFGGELRGADLTACEFATFTLDKAAVAGLRVIDCELGQVTLRDGPVDGLAISGTRITRLALQRCSELPGPRVLDSTITELIMDACPAVPSLLIADSSVETIGIRACTLYDAAFERVVVGRGWFEAAQLSGTLFDAGSWKRLELVGVALTDYVAVKHTYFSLLRFERPRVDAKLDLRLDGDNYASGSMNWSQLGHNLGGVRGP